MVLKNKKELLRQIEAFGLKNKLADLAKKEEARRPFRHLPKQFSKGILIGNIAIVPKKHTGTRYVYVIADMIEANILYEQIYLKQTAIMVAHHLAENKAPPQRVLEYDMHFASKLFEIQQFKSSLKLARKQRDEVKEEIYMQRLDDANHYADLYKAKIQQIFYDTFEV